jgi:hypothetical protein
MVRYSPNTDFVVGAQCIENVVQRLLAVVWQSPMYPSDHLRVRKIRDLEPYLIFTKCKSSPYFD